ncbi:MAG TPA: transketolase [Streptosporangiaceae bacterium]|nr:transketolase [Streptosporangiaceae bacterium]
MGTDRDNAMLAELGRQLRVDAVRAAGAAGSGHPTSSMSAADLMAVLIARHLRYDFTRPDDPRGDHLIFSKGHASPLLYAIYKAVGAIDDDELLGFRGEGSRLEGHPTPRLPWVDVATGSLGQGLPIGAGVAMAGRRFDRLPYHVWVLCGDSELAEGSMWEAFEYAGYERLGNLTAIVDVNRLGQRGPTRHGWNLDAYARRIAAFGWDVVEIDGHDIAAIDKACAHAAADPMRPVAILARTRKGRGVTAVEDAEGRHGKPLPDLDSAVAELGGRSDIRVSVREPEGATPAPPRSARPGPVRLPAYEPRSSIATRTAFGEALTAVGAARPDVIVLDGEVSDSTRTGMFAKEYPDRFVECYIAEQQMIAAAVGLAVRGWTPYAATFAAFLSRAYDFIRMAAISGIDLNLAGSHAGVSIGQDGPSQMGLEDIAALRAIYGSTVLYPCDGNSTAALTAAMAGHPGISYLRTTRDDTEVLYAAEETFEIGGSKIVRGSPDDEVAIVAAGITVHEALRAADKLMGDGIAARVIDAYSIKPIDADTLREAAAVTRRVITVEDHRPEGGLGDAVQSVICGADTPVRVTRLAVGSMPASATRDQQLRQAGIDADAIAGTAHRLISA